MTDEVKIATLLMTASDCEHEEILSEFCIEPSTYAIVLKELKRSIYHRKRHTLSFHEHLLI